MDTDLPSFEAYVRARTLGLSRIAYLLTGDHHLAEDLVQQTFLSVAGRWERLAAGGDPDAYVRKVLYHQHVSWWRRARRITQVSLTGVDRPLPDRTDQVGVTVAVQQALARLGPRQRAALVLRYFEDLTEAETAEVLGCGVGTVKSQVRDGLARLRTLAPELAELLEVTS
ncbi:SigE family RNA polymerase sigma factor [Micromonospora sp. NPDC023956]|uniref:SigE family RNA polymerase sigma factor n=1 Tax=Micromonospora sp. NPDC023956 TaxID=3155722 RepID=UPI0033E6D463